MQLAITYIAEKPMNAEQYSMTKLRSGIDLVKVSRLAKAYENFGLRFLNRIYDNLEIEQFQKIF